MRFTNGQGTHTLAVRGGEVLHSLRGSPAAAVNAETARAANGNRLTDVVAVAGPGFADLDDVHVLAVDKAGAVWHAARLPNGAWTRWGNVKDEMAYAGHAVGVTCASEGRKLTVVITDQAGSKKTTVRHPDGTWTK